MTIQHFLTEPVNECMRQIGPHNDIVLSSRLRLARNFKDTPFPHRASAEQLAQVAQRVQSRADELGSEEQPYWFVDMNELIEQDRYVLVEKHLISPQHAVSGQHKGLLLREDGAASIMVNEEDHLRIQFMLPGLQFKPAWEGINRIDDIIEARHDFAFHDGLGYLTCCPTNVGTGLRASVMMHLPGLVLTKQIHNVLAACSQLGLAVRGIYGEGTEALGNLFQISNQLTLGHSEAEIMDSLEAVTQQIIEQEQTIRTGLMKENADQLQDKVWRAYATLRHARIMDSSEAMALLSDLKLGMDLGIIKQVPPEVYPQLMVLTRPNFLQKQAHEQLPPARRDAFRAEMIRTTLTNEDHSKGGIDHV